MNVFYNILFVVITTSFFVAGNYITAQWARTNNNLLWIPVFISACLGYVLFGFLIKRSNLSISTGLVDAILVIASILIGLFIFKDLISAKQLIGLILACIAVVLLI